MIYIFNIFYVTYFVHCKLVDISLYALIMFIVDEL